MFDPKRKISIEDELTVGGLIDILKTLPQEAKVACDGDKYFFIHTEDDESYVNIDSSEMSDEYPEEEDEGNAQ